MFAIRHISGYYFVKRAHTNENPGLVAARFINTLKKKKIFPGNNANRKLNDFINGNIKDILSMCNFTAVMIGAYLDYKESLSIRKKYIEDHGTELCLNKHYVRNEK